MTRTLASIALTSLLLAACSTPMPTPDANATDARADVSSTPDAELDSSMQEDTGVRPMDSGTVDSGVVIDSGVRVDTGVIVDTGVRDTGLPPCTLDPNNCGMCGRVCGQGVYSGRTVCAEVATREWDCVQFCAPAEAACTHPNGGRMCCSIGACGLGGIGCR